MKISVIRDIRVQKVEVKDAYQTVVTVSRVIDSAERVRRQYAHAGSGVNARARCATDARCESDDGAVRRQRI